jgi:hypothetical protein
MPNNPQFREIATTCQHETTMSKSPGSRGDDSPADPREARQYGRCYQAHNKTLTVCIQCP